MFGGIKLCYSQYDQTQPPQEIIQGNDEYLAWLFLY